MPRSNITPVDKKRDFALTELFFSTTDKKGVIRYGNKVFSRIAGYPLNELQGQPHNIIRHPDMPRSAFKLVWDYLNQGKVVAAYVKNMASNGEYYWVIALVMPCEDGYLSIRLKPSSDFFQIVKKAYSEVLEAEAGAQSTGLTSKETLQAGTSRLLEVLSRMGYTSYDAFMWDALAAEMTSRNSKLNRDGKGRSQPRYTSPSSSKNVETKMYRELSAAHRHCAKIDEQLGLLFSKLDTFSRLGEEIVPKTDFILRLGEQIRLLSMNAQIQSARLGETGTALSVVASKLGHHSKHGTDTISRLKNQLSDLEPTISDLVFNAIVSKLKIEMMTCFLDEILTAESDTDATSAYETELKAIVSTLICSFIKSACEITGVIGQLQKNLTAVNKEAGKMNEFIKTLKLINLFGKVETSRSSDMRNFMIIFEQAQKETQEAERVLESFLQLVGENTAQITTVDQLDISIFSNLDTFTKQDGAGRISPKDAA